MSLSPFLASRYLRPKRTFVSIITVISVLGVALGVWLLTVVIAVFTGYGDRIQESILASQPHLTVGDGFMRGWPEVVEAIESVEGVKWVTPFVNGQVVMDFNETRSFPKIFGMMPPTGAERERMQKQVVRGEFFGGNDLYSAVVGRGFAEEQKIEIGDKLLLYAQPDMKRLMDMLNSDSESRNAELAEIKEMTAPQEVTVTGILEWGGRGVEANPVFLHFETAQILYGFDREECHFVTVRTDDGFKADVYRLKLMEKLPDHLPVRTWMEIFQFLFQTIAAERQSMYLILSLVVIVSGFCIMNTMIIVTFQKRSEIGILKALGAREGQVATVFLAQGILVGIAGVIVGLIMAHLTLHFRNDLAGWIMSNFSVDLYLTEGSPDGSLPAKQTLRDTLIISTSAFVACAVASLIPAVIAARLQPARTLRSE